MDLLQKKQKLMVQHSGYYADELEEGNVLQQSKLTEADFAAYDAGQMDEQQAESFRQRLQQMMLVDESLADSTLIKTKYRDIWESAQAERTSLQTDADRTGLSKVKNDFKGKKKAAAKAKLSAIDKAKNALRLKRTVDSSYKISGDYFPLKESFLQELSEFKLREFGDDSVSLGDKQQELIARIAANKDDPSKADQVAADQAQLERINVMTGRETNIIGKCEANPGAFQYKCTLFMMGPQERSLNALTRQIHEANPQYSSGNLYASDIHRDVCRWSQPIGKSQEATAESAGEAFRHVNGLDSLKDRTADSLTPEEITSAKQNVEFLKGKLVLFDNEIRDFFASMPPSLFTKNPDYPDLIENCEMINEFYKKSQSLANVCRLIRFSPVFSKLTEDERKQIEDIYVNVSAVLGFTLDRTAAGRKWDKKVFTDKSLPDPDAVPTLKTYDEIVRDARAKMEKERK